MSFIFVVSSSIVKLDGKNVKYGTSSTGKITTITVFSTGVDPSETVTVINAVPNKLAPVLK